MGAEGSFGVAAQGKQCFCVVPTGFVKSLIYQIFVYAKSSSSVQRPTIIVISPLKSIMDEQLASNEFGLSACELRFDCETLTAILRCFVFEI